MCFLRKWSASTGFLGLVVAGGDLIGRKVIFTRVQVGWSVLDYVKALVQIKKFRIFKAFLKYAYPRCWYDNTAKHKWNILQWVREVNVTTELLNIGMDET